MSVQKLLAWLKVFWHAMNYVPEEKPFMDEQGNLCIWKVVPYADDDFMLQSLCSMSMSSPVGIGLDSRFPPYPHKQVKVIIEPAVRAKE